jgi:hypothetical protein
MGMGVFVPAVAMALACQRLIAQEGLVTHGREATQRRESAPVNSLAPARTRAA